MTVLTVVLVCAVLTSQPAFGLPQGVHHASQGVHQASLGVSLGGVSSGGGLGSPFTTTTTSRPPIPIIRHINRVNNDGSYTFGYESGDGSYRVETRGLDGLIQGRYGYMDEQGVKKEVDYTAGSATGYEPRGQGITVPPRPPPLPPGAVEDDGSWKPQTQAPLTHTGPIATRTRAREFSPQPPPQTFSPQPPPPPPQPQATFAQPQSLATPFQDPFPALASDFSHRQINAPSPPQPVDFGQHLSQPAPPQTVFRQPQQQASPIEQFLRQQLTSAPQQPQPQQQPITRQLF